MLNYQRVSKDFLSTFVSKGLTKSMIHQWNWSNRWIQDDLASRNGISHNLCPKYLGSLLVFDHPWKWIRQNLIQNPKANGWLNPSQTLIGFKCGSWRSYQVRRSYRSLMLVVLRHLQRASFSFVSCEISWRSMRPASVSKITWSVFFGAFFDTPTIRISPYILYRYCICVYYIHTLYTHSRMCWNHFFDFPIAKSTIWGI